MLVASLGGRRGVRHLACVGARLTATALMAGACASFQQPMSQRGAVRTAVVAVCGERRGADAACAVRSIERVGRGYRVGVDRRPPAGDDRLVVSIQPSGRLGGWAVDVQPFDSTSGTARP